MAILRTFLTKSLKIAVKHKYEVFHSNIQNWAQKCYSMQKYVILTCIAMMIRKIFYKLSAT